MQIVYAATPAKEVLVNPSVGPYFTASFQWAGGSQAIHSTGNCCGGMDYGSTIGRFIGSSRYFGWGVTCAAYCGDPQTYLSVHGIQLIAIDNTPPSIAPVGTNNIWMASGWVRGSGWPATFTASDDSGVCNMGATIGGEAIQGPVDWLHNTHSWTQCPTPQTQPLTVDTTRYPDGPVSMNLWAQDAASPTNQASPATTVHVDNQPVSLSLTGASDSSSTGATTYVTATATAGPSGVSGFACSVDRAAASWYPGATVRVPVDGLGAHQVTCTAYDGARDANGTLGQSAPATFTTTIRQPTVAGLWFPTVKNPIRCSVHRERVRIPGKWVTIHRHHRPVWVQRPSHVVVRRVTRCHAHVVRRRTVSWTVVVRHGKKHWVKHVRYVRVVLPPRFVNSVAQRARFGHGSVVAGWLGTSGLIPLPGQLVAVLAAPANGSGAFTQVAAATTGSNGLWATVIPPGPSRIIDAVYMGSSTTEPASSNQAGLAVPARLRLSIRPRRAHWGGTIRITGRLLGGYVPASGELVVLYIGWHGGSTEIGHLYTDKRGRFSAPYRFLRGNGTERYWIWAASAKESDYPYAPARSSPIAITVSQPG
jgi:hypothetical protein